MFLLPKTSQGQIKLNAFKNDINILKAVPCLQEIVLLKSCK